MSMKREFNELNPASLAQSRGGTIVGNIQPTPLGPVLIPPAKITKASAASARPRRLPGRAFTIVELLTVVAIIAVLSVLTAPALSSLKARDVTRGGNLVADLTQQARQNSMMRGVLTALVLLNNNTGKAEWNNRAFVLMELSPGSSTWNPVTRWCKLPDGVVVQPATYTGSTSAPTPLNLPSLEGKTVAASECIYQVFSPSGALLTSGVASGSPSIQLYEGTSGSGGQVTVQNTANYYSVVINPYTGLAKIDRP
ncbi:hypothetical protein BH09VER1_BH09VER1_07420 [soil metagenome]